MRLPSVVRRSAAALILCAGFAAAASAEDKAAPADGKPTPSAAAGAAAQSACIEETGDYETHGKIVTFVIGLENTCEKPMKCEVFAYVVGAKGPSSGHATMLLGAKSSGAAAKKSYAMKVKMAGGTAQVSRQCRVL